MSACGPQQPQGISLENLLPTPTIESNQPTPEATRPIYKPGELVDYIAQTGDTLPALAAHFNTTEKEIREANSILPAEVTTLPPGLPMKIPIYYQTLWGSPFQILPDSLFVNGPAQSGFNTVEYVQSQSGWLKNYEFYAGNEQRRGGELVDYVANNFSISPRLLLALIEYQTGALSEPFKPRSADSYPLGYRNSAYQGLYRQLVWAANLLNNGYYGWRTGHLAQFDHIDGELERPDPWQNAASVALQYYYAQTLPTDPYTQAIHGQGLAKTYTALFGDPWADVQAHIPGSLTQPEMVLPFEAGKAWTYTGGPHTGWGEGEPFAAVDFAPPAVVGGCAATEEWATAVADGVIARREPAEAVLDLDGDGDEHTGWVVFYLHLADYSVPPVGTQLTTRQPIGHPSCEGGEATGTHVHIARKYNGEWVPAGGPLAFDLEGWVVENGSAAYQGNMVRFSHVVRACTCSDKESQIQASQP